MFTLAACAGLAYVVPAQAAVAVPAVMVAPVATADAATPSPLLQEVWWDRWHHWHHHHHHHHWHPRG